MDARAIIVGMALAAVAAGCGAATEQAADERARASGSTTPPPEWITYRDSAAGFTVTYPSDWHRASETLTPRLDDPREILALGTYWLRPGSDRCANHVPENALEDLGPQDAFLTLQERRDPSTERSGPRPATFPLGGDTRGDADMCIPTREPLTMWVPFKDRGRAFYALYVLGPDASAETRTELLRILDSLEVEPRR